MSARTGGYILLQLLFDLANYGVAVDRVLDGPTNEVWIQPWLRHLHVLGVTYQEGMKVTGLRLDGTRIAGVQIEGGEELRADWVVCALPVEVATTLMTDEMKAVDPRLASLEFLQTRWMNGVMFYLARDVPLVHGHVIYIDSPWALTSISQAQFWPGVDLAARGNGQVHGILSVDVSEWEQPGMLYGKPAMQCSKSEIVAEVWAQLKAHLDVGGDRPLQDGDRVGSSSTPTSATPTPGRTSTSNPCSSTPPAPGTTARTPRRRSRTSSWPVTTSGPTPTWRPWRGPTRPPAGLSTPSCTPPGPANPSARSGPCTSRRCSPRCAPSTTFAITASIGRRPAGRPVPGPASDPGGDCYDCPGSDGSVKRSPCAAADPESPPPRPRRTKAITTAEAAPAMGPAMYTQ